MKKRHKTKRNRNSGGAEDRKVPSLSISKEKKKKNL